MRLDLLLGRVVAMNIQSKLTWSVITALVVAAIGIAVLWAVGVPFPFVVPPGILILLAGAVVLVVVRRRRWSPLIGVALGAFIIIGFALSPGGVSNLTGGAGPLAAVGQTVELLGSAAAVVAGVAALIVGRRG